MIIKVRPECKRLNNIDHKIIRDELGVFKDFVSVLEDKVNLDIFYYKHKDIDFVEGINIRRKNISLAEYEPLKRRIVYGTKYFKESIMHELFHVASTLVSKDTIFLGLCQVDRSSGVSFGIGLTEGMTCLLDDKYFPDYTELKHEVVGESYNVLKRLCYYIEMIYGSEFVEECYFNADLQSFIDVLSKDIGLENTQMLICALDNIHSAHISSLLGPQYVIKSTKVLFDNFYQALKIIEKMIYKNIFTNYINGEIKTKEFERAVYYLKEIVSQQLRSEFFPIKSKRISDKKFNEIAAEARQEVLMLKRKKEM